MCSGIDGGGLVNEEIIGDESPAYKPHLQAGEDGSYSKLSALSTTVGGSTASGVRGQRAPAAPLGHGAEDEKENQKVKLQRLIRDFAHDAVGPGLDIEASSSGNLLDSYVDPNSGCLQALMRMDRRLSRIELWPGVGDTGSSATVTIPLQHVENITKGIAVGDGEAVDGVMDGCTLTVTKRGGSDLRLLFQDPSTRDRAYTCLRIFQMSVDQTHDGREGESEMTENLDDQENRK